MSKNKKIEVKGTEIAIFKGDTEDFISLTDIARYKDSSNTDDIIKNWLRNRNTIELLCFWEQMYNPNFKPVEFDGFRKQGLNQSERLSQLNQIAITQMTSLVNHAK
jgi:hypothetical protein